MKATETGYWDKECYRSAGKEPKLVCKSERYPLYIVGLTSLHERGWTLFFVNIAPGERQRRGMGLFIDLLTGILEFPLISGRVASPYLQVEEGVMTVCIYTPKSSSHYQSPSEYLGNVNGKHHNWDYFWWQSSNLLVDNSGKGCHQAGGAVLQSMVS